MFFNKISFNKHTLAIIGLLFTAFCYAVLGVNSRLLEQGFMPMTQVYVRIAVGFLLSLVIFHPKLRVSKLKSIPHSDWFWLLMMGVVGYAVTIWLITLANLSTTLVNSAVIFATVPFVVYAYSHFLFKEKIKPVVVGLLLLAMYGISVVASKSLIPNISNFGMGELFAICAVLTGGWWSIGIKKLSNHLNYQEITIMTMCIAATSGMVIALIKGEPLTLHSFTIPAVIVGIAIGGVLNVGLTFLENFCFRNINLVLGNQLLMTSTLFSLLLGFIFYQESITFPELAGSLCIVLSVWQATKLLRHN